MIHNPGVWYSEFRGKRGMRQIISKECGLVTVASYQHGFAGGHSMMYLEFIDDLGDAITERIDVDFDRKSKIEIRDSIKDLNQGSDERSAHFHYQSFTMSAAQRLKLQQAIGRFKSKIPQHYTYRFLGGYSGRLTTSTTRRGVNCADFIVKVLREAGIADIGDRVFLNSPSRVSGGSMLPRWKLLR